MVDCAAAIEHYAPTGAARVVPVAFKRLYREARGSEEIR